MAIYPLLADGCAALRLELESPLGLGRLASRKGRPGVVIGVPHGTSDPYTDRIGVELAQRTGFGVVIAIGYGEFDARHRRLNVNRPTEGVPGGSSTDEVWSERARHIYDAYVARVKGVAEGPLGLYVEVHGTGRRGNVGRIEIATVGVSREEAWWLRSLLELRRDAHLCDNGETPRLDVLVEPLDRVSLAASLAKQIGILKLPAQAIHIELPRIARTVRRQAYTDALAEFLTAAARILRAGER